MGVASPDGGIGLVALPTFCLVSTDQPTYPLHVAGAGELAVVPLTAEGNTATPADGDTASATADGPRASTSPPDSAP
jgi:hypothetical protein